MVISQGDIYWVRWGDSDQSDTSVPHPYVIIQDNRLNHSPVETVAACALTSNLHRISLPGNVLLEAGEANLPRHSVVEVSKLTTLKKAQLGDYIGTLSQRRIDQILAGIGFVQRVSNQR